MSELGGNKHLIRIENPGLIYFLKQEHLFSSLCYAVTFRITLAMAT